MSEHHDTPSGVGREAHAPWRAYADTLADWAQRTLVTRDDSYTGYYDDGGSIRAARRSDSLDLPVISNHFRGENVGNLVAFYVSSPDGECRITAIDLDNHGGRDDVAEANVRFARHAEKRARTAGLACRLIDSDGGGGFHIIVSHDPPISLFESWRLGRWLVHDHQAFDLEGAPEIFPKTPRLKGKKYGSCLRLPGRHPRRPHWDRVWDPITASWLEGEAAICSLLELRGRQVDLSGVIPPEFENESQGAVDPSDVIDNVPCSLKLSKDARTASRALTFLGPRYFNDYDAWVRIGMALNGLGEAGLGLWGRWSAQSPKFNPDELRVKWDSFRPGGECRGIDLGTLFHHAKQEGWEGPDDELEAATGVRWHHDRRRRRVTAAIPLPGQTPEPKEKNNGSQYDS